MPIHPLSYFDKRAQEYDMVQKQELTGNNLLAQLLGSTQVEPSFQTLDLGCGPGNLSAELAHKVSHVVALDISPAMIAVARKRSAGSEYSNVSFLIADANNMPFAPDSFDLILCRSVLQFTDLKRALPSLRRSLRDGGSISITHLSIRSHRAVTRVRTLLGRIMRGTIPQSWRITRRQGVFKGLRALRARLRHVWFSTRYDAVRLDRDTAIAEYKHELPDCDISANGRYMRVRWPGLGQSVSEPKSADQSVTV